MVAGGGSIKMVAWKKSGGSKSAVCVKYTKHKSYHLNHFKVYGTGHGAQGCATIAASTHLVAVRGGREGGTGPEGLRLRQGPEGVGVAVGAVCFSGSSSKGCPSECWVGW